MSIDCTYTWNGKRYSKDRILRALLNESPRLTVKDQIESIRWLQEKLGLSESEIEIVAGLIDNKSLGRFMQDGRILLSNHADSTVAYHEAFHRVWRMYLTPNERKAVFDQFKGRKSWKTLIEPLRQYYPTLTDQELVEEYLADEFSDFVLNPENYKVEQPVKSFFDRILDFIRGILGLSKVDLYQLYNNINNAKYNTKPNPTSQHYKGTEYADKVIIGGREISIEDKQFVVKEMTRAILAAVINKSPIALQDIIKGTTKISPASYYFGENGFATQLGLNKNVLAVNKNLSLAIGKDLALGPAGSEFYSLIKKELSFLGLDVGDEVDLETEDNKQNDPDNQRAGGEFTSNYEIDPKLAMSKQIKLLLASFNDPTNINKYGYPTPVSWSKAFMNIAEAMSGVPTEHFVEELEKLKLPYINQLLDLIKGDAKSRIIFRNDFTSNMARTQNNFNILNYEKGDIYFFDANVNTRSSKIVDTWKNAFLRNIAKNGVVDIKKFYEDLNTERKNGNFMTAFRDVLGIDLHPDLVDEEVEKIVQAIINALSKTSNTFNTNNLPDVTNIFKSFDIEGNIKDLARRQSQYEESVDLMVFAMGKKLYGLGLNNQVSIMINRVNYAIKQFEEGMTIDQKLEILGKYVPHLRSAFMVGVVDGKTVIKSQWLNKILNGEKLKLNIIYNGKNDTGEDSQTGDMDETDLYAMHLNGALKGMTMSLKHSDRSIFYGYSWEGKNEPHYVPIFEGAKNAEDVLNYLVDYVAQQVQNEIDFARVYDPQGYQHFDDKYKKEGLGGMLGEARLNALMSATDLNARKLTAQDKAVLKAELAKNAKEYKDELVKWGVIDPTGKKHLGLDKSEISKFNSNIDMIVNTAFVNEVINHIEEMKFTTGDARMYKTSVDLFKRLAAISSTGNMLVNDDATNDLIEREVASNTFTIVNPRTGEVTENKAYPLAPRGHIRGLTVKENEKYVSHLLRPATSSNGQPLISKLTGKQESVVFMVYENQLAKDYADVEISTEKLIAKARAYEGQYRKGNENDGGSWMNIFSFKNYMIRRGKWTLGMEAVFKTELAVLNAKSIEDIKNIEITLYGKTFNPFVFGENDTFQKRNYADGTFNEFDSFHTLKSQFSGFVYSTENMDLLQAYGEMQAAASSIFKTANHILMPSAIMGTNLQLMNHMMLTQGVDVVHMGSANKVGGIDAKLAANIKGKDITNKKHLYNIKKHGLEFYDTQGYFNDEAITENLDLIQYFADVNYLKDQVEVGNKVKTEIKGSTQSLKIMLSNLIINGKERFEGAGKMAEDYKKLIADMVTAKANKLLKELDMVNADDSPNMQKFKKILLESQQGKTAPDNIVNSLINFIEDPVFEILPNKNKIEPILYAIITSRAINFNRPGNSYPQVPSTGYEKLGSRQFELDKDGNPLIDEKGDLIAKSNQDTLKFYDFHFDEEGNVTKVDPAEVMIPLPDHWIQPVLKMAGTRNLVEAIQILNARIAAGEVTTELTFKALRIPNQQLSSNDIVTVKKFFLPNSQSYAVVPTELVVKVGSDFDVDKLNIYWPEYGNAPSEKELVKYLDEYDEFVKNFDALEVPTFEEFLLTKDVYELKLRKNSNTNRLLELEKQILLHPSNAHHLLLPVVDDILAKDAYQEIYVGLLGNKAEDEKSVIKSMLPQTNVKNSIIFVHGKFGVGIVALDITFNSLGQMDNITLNPTYNDITETDSEGGPAVKPTNLLFEGLGGINSLSNYMDSELNMITEVLSQLLTTQVDNVKNPVGIKLGINTQTLNVVGYLIKRGVGIKTIIKFIKQPLITEYLEKQRFNESLTNKSNGYEKSKAQIVSDLIGKDDVEIFTGEVITDEMLNEGLQETNTTSRNQKFMLKYFLELQNQSKALSTFMQYQTADTKSLKDWSGVVITNKNLKETYDYDIVANSFDSISTGLLSPFNRSRDLYGSIFGDMYLYNQSEAFNKLNDFGNVLVDLQKTRARKEKVVSTIQNDFMSFWVINKVLSDQPDMFKRLFGQLQDVPSLAQRIADIKKKIPNNPLFKAFHPLFKTKLDKINGKYVDSLRLFERELGQLDTNDMIESLRELYEIDARLYKDLVNFMFIQTGMNNSPYNYSKIVPIGDNTKKDNVNELEYYFNGLLETAVQQVLRTPNDELSTIIDEFIDKFQKNNPSFLRRSKDGKKPFKTYPLRYASTYDQNGEVMIQDLETGSKIPVSGTTYFKHYDKTDVPIQVAQTQTPTQLFDPNSPVVNIYAGSNENADLSNFASRPFTMEGVKYRNVEQAFQVFKFGFSEQTEENAKIAAKILDSRNSKEIKALGRTFKGFDSVEWDKVSSDLMKEIIKESFVQNPEALKKLAATGSSLLTHSQDTTKWKTEFPRILMEVRAELIKPAKQTTVTKPQDATAPRLSESEAWGGMTDTFSKEEINKAKEDKTKCKGGGTNITT